MILVDTSVWVNHFRRGEPILSAALEAGEVLTHAFVIGEIACGNLKRRSEVLSLMRELPPSPTATDEEAQHFIDQHKLMGRGIGYIDVHLLASALLAGNATLWTHDKRLSATADRLALKFQARQ